MAQARFRRGDPAVENALFSFRQNCASPFHAETPALLVERGQIVEQMLLRAKSDAPGQVSRNGVRGSVEKLPTKGPVPDPRYAPYVPRLIEDFLAREK